MNYGDCDSKSFFHDETFIEQLREKQQAILINMRNTIIHELTTTLVNLKKVDGLKEAIDERPRPDDKKNEIIQFN